MDKPQVNSPTLKDVAALAGVSIGTISRVINDSGAVKASTKQRVLAAIEKLNYIPNAAARSLVTGRANALSLILVQQNPIRLSVWPYEMTLLQGISDFLKGKGWDLQISWCFREEANDPGYLRRLLNRRSTDGVLMASLWPLELPALVELSSRNIPYLLVGFRNQDHPIRSIEFDNKGAARQIAQHLIDLGHRRIALIAGEVETLHMADRLVGVQAALSGSSIPLPQEMVRAADWTMEAGYEAMLELLATSPELTAVICGNDNLAAGAIKALTERGIRVPDDVSVVGFDDSPVASVTQPALTTVSVPLYEVGRLAAERLFDEIQEDGQASPTRAVLPCRVVVRDSTAPPPGARHTGKPRPEASTDGEDAG